MTSSTNAVAVILRTKDRPEFLDRALADIAAQSFSDFTVVVVNDGGAPLDEAVLKRAHPLPNGSQLLLINNSESVGRADACNVGLAATDSEFVVLHDDDDTWEPRFLELTVAFLRDPVNEVFAGVITRTNLVHEEVEDDGRITVTSSEPFNPGLRRIDLIDLAARNLFPPISFLYRRSIHDLVGGYNPDLRVMMDWDFNLRLIRHRDIAILDAPLANWHLRESSTGAAANVTTTEGLRYEQDRARLLNSLLRVDLDEGQFGLGVLVSLLHRIQRDGDVAEYLNGVLRAEASRQGAELLHIRGTVESIEHTVNTRWRLLRAIRDRLLRRKEH